MSIATRRMKRAVRGRTDGCCAVSGKRSVPSSFVILKWKICAGGGFLAAVLLLFVPKVAFADAPPA